MSLVLQTPPGTGGFHPEGGRARSASEGGDRGSPSVISVGEVSWLLAHSEFSHSSS